MRQLLNVFAICSTCILIAVIFLFLRSGRIIFFKKKIGPKVNEIFIISTTRSSRRVQYSHEDGGWFYFNKAVYKRNIKIRT